MAWENGELITATKLNSMENGIGENNMSYEKHTWETGELITADKLNHMEEGIEGGGGGGSFYNKKISITVVNNKPGMLTWECSYFISENKYVIATTIEIPANSQIVQDLMIPMPIDSAFYYDMPLINQSYDTVTASNLVNCTFEFSGGNQDLVVTDPTMDASVTLTYSRL